MDDSLHNLINLNCVIACVHKICNIFYLHIYNKTQKFIKLLFDTCLKDVNLLCITANTKVWPWEGFITLAYLW